MTMHKELPKVDYKKILYTTDLSEAGRHAFPGDESQSEHHIARRSFGLDCVAFTRGY